jgi:hypothetical protein
MAAGSTYTPIATQTLGSGVSQVTFSSIPSTYTDLVLVINGGVVYNLLMWFNNDTATNYSDTYIAGNGTSASSNRHSSRANIVASYDGAAGTTMGTFVYNIQNYANTTTYKTAIGRASDTSDSVICVVGLWRSTAAINRIDFTGNGGNFSTGTMATLYGIAAA